MRSGPTVWSIGPSMCMHIVGAYIEVWWNVLPSSR
jgi:hypothetical protein